MGKRVFVAGATGVIGRRLIPMLVSNGNEVTGLTRGDEGVRLLASLGASAKIADVFDRESLSRSVAEAAPEIVIHQLTDLANGFQSDRIAETLRRNAHIREAGTANLVEAAKQAGALRFIAQSIAFVYAEGRLPHREGDPLDLTQGSALEQTVRGVLSLEDQVRTAFPQNHVLLRYGNLYGPGTSHDGPFAPTCVHVDAAALAACIAVNEGSGIYNIADDGSEATSAKAKHELSWDPAYRATSLTTHSNW